MVLFILAYSSVVARGLSIDCGCFGASQIFHEVGLRRLLEDFGYLLMASVVFVEALVSRGKQAQG